MAEPTEQEIIDAIHPPYQVLYLHAMLFNARAAISSISVAGEAAGLSSGSRGPQDVPPEMILNELQNVILHAGALSRFFFPPRDRGKGASLSAARAAKLRRAFQVEAGSPLEDRRLRNEIEHFEERLDIYCQQPLVGIMMPSYVGPTGDTQGVPHHFFRAFFTDTQTLQIINQTYHLPPLITELLRIEAILSEMEENGGTLRVKAKPPT